MKKLAIISAGVLPIPAIKGGAVETLIDIFLKENEIMKQYKIDTYSISSELENKFYFDLTENIQISKKKNEIFFRKLYIPQILSLIFKSYMKYPYVLKIKKLIKVKEYNYIIVENFAEISLVLKKITTAKLILHIHNDYFNKRTRKNYEILKNYIKIICVSDYIKNQIKKYYPELEDRIVTIYNCVDIQKFNFELVDKKKKDELIISYFGRIVPHKGVEILIDIFEKLLLRNKKIKLLVVGGETFSSNIKNEFIKKIEKKCKNIKNKIIFTGYIDHIKLPEIYSVSDFVIVPSLCQEACPLVILESVAMKIPVIANQIGGIPYMFTNSEINLINLENNIEEIVENINKILEKKIDTNKKVEKSFLRLEKEYIPQIYFEKIKKVLEECENE